MLQFYHGQLHDTSLLGMTSTAEQPASFWDMIRLLHNPKADTQSGILILGVYKAAHVARIASWIQAAHL